MTYLKELVNKPISGEWGSDGEGIKVLRTTNFTNKGAINFKNVISRDISTKIIDQKKLLKGDIIIEKSGGSPTQPVGRVVFFEEEGDYVCNNFTSILRPRREKIFPKYLHYMLFANHKFGLTKMFQNKTTGIINLQLTRYLAKSKIPVPPLKTQIKIAQILDETTVLRNKTEQLIEEYDSLTHSVFLDMFGDPVINQKGWTLSSVEKVCIKIIGGGTPRKSKGEYFTGDIPWVTPKDMKRLYINNSKIKITEKAVAESSTKLIPINSILMVIRSGILKKKLPVAISISVVTVNQDMKAFIANTNIINPKYLMFFFLIAQKYLLAKVRVVTADNIEFNQIKQMRIPVPSLELQNQFAEKIALIEQQKELAKQELKESEDLFNCLLQKAFKGELV